MSNECTLESFLDDVKDHKLEIISDYGVNRHLRMKKDGTNCYRYDITTWDGYLCISGDMGCYVFSRISDMFDFFIMDKNDFNNDKTKLLSINPSYWGEKLQAYPDNGYKKFSEDVCKSYINEKIDGNTEDWDESDISDLKDDISYSVFFESNPVRIYDALNEYTWESDDGTRKWKFDDVWEWFDYTEEYTYHYIWCLYAIVYAIKKYRGLINEEWIQTE